MNIKKLMRKAHLYLGLFTIPIGMLFAISGIVLLLGANEMTFAKIDQYIVDTTVESGNEVAFLKNWTKENNIQMPKNINVSPARQGAMRVGSVNYHILIRSNGYSMGNRNQGGNQNARINENNTTTITVVKPSIIGIIITIHKAHAKSYINILSILLAISMVLFYVSGVIIASFKKNVDGKRVFKKDYMVVLVLGFVITIIVAIISIS